MAVWLQVKVRERGLGQCSLNVLVGWPIADILPTKWLPVKHRSGTDQEKSASRRPTSYPLSHAANKCLIPKYAYQMKLLLWCNLVMRVCMFLHSPAEFETNWRRYCGWSSVPDLLSRYGHTAVHLQWHLLLTILWHGLCVVQERQASQSAFVSPHSHAPRHRRSRLAPTVRGWFSPAAGQLVTRWWSLSVCHSVVHIDVCPWEMVVQMIAIFIWWKFANCCHCHSQFSVSNLLHFVLCHMGVIRG